MGDIGTIITSGSMLVALPIAVAAGLVAFISPCVLPLAPGYVSYVTGMTGVELSTGERKPRVLAGSLLFVLGFSVVFVSYGALFGGLGSALLRYENVITRVMGLLVIAMGLAFMGVIPWFQREYRWMRVPKWGVIGAPGLGVLFGLGWTPCIGPTLTAVQSLALAEASALRGALCSSSHISRSCARATRSRAQCHCMLCAAISGVAVACSPSVFAAALATCLSSISQCAFL